MNIKDFVDAGKHIYINCTFNQSYPIQQPDIDPGELDYEPTNEEINQTQDLVNYIKNKLGLKIPEMVIKEVLDAETEYYMNGGREEDDE